MTYQIWIEGFLATGMEGCPAKAEFFSRVNANSFQEACDKIFEGDSNYNPENLTLWGCRLFDNEQDARKSFG